MGTKKLLTSITTYIILICMPVVAHAVQEGDFDITVVSGSYSYAPGTLTITANGTYTITMATSGYTTTTDKIVVSSGLTAVNITLDGVSIDVSGTSGACAFDMSGATVSLLLTGTNTLRSGNQFAGINVPDDGADLTIDGSGILNATGGSYCAGIGGVNNGNGGTVTINGGTVNATGGNYGTGIGGGSSGNGGTVTINGGTVTAVGGIYGAGVGGGWAGSGGTVTISGGTVNATGGESGAGIGGGWDGNGGTVTISGGTVNATGGESGAGIGGGLDGNGGTVTITGGMVNATGGTYGAGIGGGDGGSRGTLVIDGGSVKRSGGNASREATAMNDAGLNVYLVTLTVATANTQITAGVIGGVTCAGTPDAASGVYGINDVYTDGSSKVYFWLPSSGTGSTTSVELTAGASSYLNSSVTTDPNNLNSAVLASSSDLTAPTLSSGNAIRTSNFEATIDFSTSEIGTAYYLVLPSPSSAPTSAQVQGGTSLGQVPFTVTGQSVTLPVGAQDIYVVVQDAAGNVSNPPFRITAAAYPALPVTNTPNPVAVTYAGSTIDLSAIGLFTLDVNAGTPTYSIESGGTGTGTLTGTMLTVTSAGTFTIGLTTAATAMYQAGALVTATLTVVIAPTISSSVTSLPPASIADGPYSINVAAALGITGTPTPTVTVTGLPDGLTYSGGFISGTPATPGSYQVTVTVSNAVGTVTATVTLLVGAADYHAVATPSAVDFGYRYRGYDDAPSAAFTLLNDGIYAFTLGDFTTTGNLRWVDGTAFTIGGAPAGGTTLAPFDPATPLSVSVKDYLAPGKYLDTLFLYYGGNDSLPVLTASFTVYDYAPPFINRQVELIVADGFWTNPSPGISYVKSATDLIITITPPSATPDLQPEVTTSRNTAGDVSLTHDEAAGTWQARVRRVQSDITVWVKAYNSSNSTGNDAVTSSTVRVWATAGNLHIVSPQATDIKVYSLTGVLIINHPIQEGETVIPLDKGLYIVKTGDTIKKVTTLP